MGVRIKFSDPGTSIGPPQLRLYAVDPVGVLMINLEYGFRKTFTDYLDDVSTVYVDPAVLEAESSELAARMADRTQNGNAEIGSNRGNSTSDDWFSFAGIGLTFRIGGRRNTCPSWD